MVFSSQWLVFLILLLEYEDFFCTFWENPFPDPPQETAREKAIRHAMSLEEVKERMRALWREKEMKHRYEEKARRQNQSKSKKWLCIISFFYVKELLPFRYWALTCIPILPSKAAKESRYSKTNSHEMRQHGRGSEWPPFYALLTEPQKLFVNLLIEIKAEPTLILPKPIQPLVPLNDSYQQWIKLVKWFQYKLHVKPPAMPSFCSLLEILFLISFIFIHLFFFSLSLSWYLYNSYTSVSR